MLSNASKPRQVQRVYRRLQDVRRACLPAQLRLEVANCAKLFNDMTEAVNQNKSHFIGTFVYWHQPAAGIFPKYIIIDGQQRITDLILFARALFDFAEDELKKDINAKFLRHTFGKMKSKCKLRQTKFDAPVFAKIIDGETNFTDDEKTSDMYRNFNCFCGQRGKFHHSILDNPSQVKGRPAETLRAVQRFFRQQKNLLRAVKVFVHASTVDVFGLDEQKISMPSWIELLRESVRRFYALDKDIFRCAT